MPTIKDVAKEAGVSIATVSYVLNKRNDLVSEKTRLHVLEVARSLGYRPNVTAQNLQASRSSLIGYAWHTHPRQQPNMVMDQFIYHLARASEAQKYHLLTFTHSEDDPVAVYDDMIRSGRLDGFVLADTTYDDARIRYLIEKEFPFVSFGRANDAWDFYGVDTDGEIGTYLATQHLLELGHRRIAFMGWPQESLTGNHRLNGYRKALAEAQCSADFTYHSSYETNIIDEIFRDWDNLAVQNRPTAIVAVSDYVAVETVRAAERFGYVVGKTLSITGFDDAPEMAYFRPRLTTLQQPIEEITQTLIEILNDMIDGQKPSEKIQLLAPNLIIRDSTGVPQND